MSMQLVQIHIDEMPIIQAEEKFSRFEDTVMANPYIDDKERRKYISNLEKHIRVEKVKTKIKNKTTAKKVKTTSKANRMAMELMGIGVTEVNG